MAIKLVTKVILNILIIISNFSINAQENYYSDNDIYIEVQLIEEINLDENYVSKRENENQIIFSFGIETLGEINDFIFSKKVGKQKTISFEEFEKINISTIKELNEILRSKEMFKKPNEVFKKIYIVEKDATKCSIKLYSVIWKKRLFIE